ncbi:MAG: Holliday junction resolvase RuvX [Puniceicoccales bacterium]|jgi:putative Holliday junction resolvase|nr:Holliday junction resolvase RuvX [Puniceicoccales bacterium]
MGRYLAIDYGRKRIGLAWGDPTFAVAVARPPIVCGPAVDFWAALGAVVREGEIVAFVVGLPLDHNGGEGDWAREVQAFGERLREHFSLPVHFSDERLTSYQVDRDRPAGRNPLAKLLLRRRSGKDDSRAAALLLQDFFEEQRMAKGLR